MAPCLASSSHQTVTQLDITVIVLNIDKKYVQNDFPVLAEELHILSAPFEIHDEALTHLNAFSRH